jgi:hypothetical protein
MEGLFSPIYSAFIFVTAVYSEGRWLFLLYRYNIYTGSFLRDLNIHKEGLRGESRSKAGFPNKYGT